MSNLGFKVFFFSQNLKYNCFNTLEIFWSQAFYFDLVKITLIAHSCVVLFILQLWLRCSTIIHFFTIIGLPGAISLHAILSYFFGCKSDSTNTRVFLSACLSFCWNQNFLKLAIMLSAMWSLHILGFECRKINTSKVYLISHRQ